MRKKNECGHGHDYSHPDFMYIPVSYILCNIVRRRYKDGKFLHYLSPYMFLRKDVLCLSKFNNL